MDFNMLDIIIVGLILFLSIKGLVNGFTQELFNFIALIGGVAVAARVNTVVGEKFSDLEILPHITPEVQNFIGFLLTLLIVWAFISFIASIIGRISSDTPGFFSRLLGYIIGVARYIAIFSLIVFGITKADFLRENLSKHYENSQLFTPMSEIGAKLLDLNQTTINSSSTEEKLDSNNTTNIEQNSSN